ncbi:zinc ribbon domain-containing protein [Dehalogenimonas etheniformans]|uniref:CT398-like coiled coil hairpin domain-containing protein n=1 Tax=Dehalogenimonas etheniformans TaxID=1536648 RepID=A0A2P5P7T5_9CHLR|nr:C4-type zinc ribbon domain-containing protein [Dehalogenimonas etheniformans]PPD58357.1 hypothetical protein JP09_004415 [Dehalogenimonas etheniformans]QNT76930.1 hypothetical protein HX448_09715 [Dehalogenimonas etheniformans]
MNIPRLLFQLQEIDLAHDAAREKSGRIENELAADPLAVERNAINKQQTELRGLQHELRENDAQVDDFTDRIKGYEEKLYSGRITSPKELTTLQKDIELLRGHRIPFEDKSLALMEAVEALEHSISDAETALQRHKETLDTHKRELIGQLEVVAAETSELETRRAALLPEIPSYVQVQYQSLRKQKGRAVSKVEQAICRACGIAVTAAWLHRARTGEIVRCTNCNRILYLE